MNRSVLEDDYNINKWNNNDVIVDNEDEMDNLGIQQLRQCLQQ